MKMQGKIDDSFIDFLISTRSLLSRTNISTDHRSVFYKGGRDSDNFYRGSLCSSVVPNAFNKLKKILKKKKY